MIRPVRTLRALCALCLLAVVGGAAGAQSAPIDYRDEFLHHFEQSSRKVLMLAEAMPEELYDWSPADGVMPVAQVYMHIARYNYLYPSTSLGVAPPADIDMDTMEDLRDKAAILEHLRRSAEHVRRVANGMTAEQLTAPTRLYGRDVAGWTVLLQLIAHMNEHVGQSVAYARTNEIVPPWSR